MPTIHEVPATQVTTYTAKELQELRPRGFQHALEQHAQYALDDSWWYESTIEEAKKLGLKFKSWDCDRMVWKAELTESIGHICYEITQGKNRHGAMCDTYKTALQAYKDRHAGIIDADDFKREFTNSLASDYMHILRKEMEYRWSAECFIEEADANERQFTENGEIYN